MASNTLRPLLRTAALTALLVAVWFLIRAADAPQPPLGVAAPHTEFSAKRADSILARVLGAEKPHPVSSAEGAAVRGRIQKEFAALRIPTRIYRGFGCERVARIGSIVCGAVTDVLADVMPGQGRAIVLMAHYDSVPAGPGAADDASGVAAIIETARALRARGGPKRHPILALITDGEEAGLLGADAFFRDAKMRARVGAVVNVEARGNQGPSLLFQTSDSDGPLIDLYADNVERYATSSLFSVIYRFLPNDTDLTPVLNAGVPGLNFAFVGNVAQYHTALDRRANLSLASLQQQGDNLLGISWGLEQSDFEHLKTGNEVYLSVLGRLLPRLPAALALPLAGLGFALLLAAAWLSGEKRHDIRTWLIQLMLPPALLIGSALSGWVLHRIAMLVSGNPDPSFAHPDLLRVSLAIGVFATALAVARFMELRRASFAVWLWMAALAIVSAALLPGLSPYFLFSLLVAAPLLFLPLWSKWEGPTAITVLCAAAIPAMFIWLGLATLGESIMGLALHPLFTIPVALAAVALLPLSNARRIPKRGWTFAIAGSAGAAVLFAILAGLQPAYSKAAPQRLNIAFIDDHIASKSYWAIFTGGSLPNTFRKQAAFSKEPTAVNFFSQRKGYTAPVGITRYAPPSVIATIQPDSGGRKVKMTLQGSSVADRLFLSVPKEASLRAVEIENRRFDVSSDSSGTVFTCVGKDCGGRSLVLDFASKTPADIVVGEQRFRLPPDSAGLVAARPVWTTPSQEGDSTIVFKHLRLH